MPDTTLPQAAAEEAAAHAPTSVHTLTRMDEPNVMRVRAQCRMQHFHVNLMDTSFFIGRERVRSRTRRTLFWRWRDRLFILLTNLALDATEFFRIPPNRVVEFGGQIEI